MRTEKILLCNFTTLGALLNHQQPPPPVTIKQINLIPGQNMISTTLLPMLHTDTNETKLYTNLHFWQL